MSVSIRLARTGKKNSPSYRIVAVPKRAKRDGENLDVIGHYNPSHVPATFEYSKELLEKWVKNGAIISSAVQKLLDGKYSYTKYDPKAEKEAKA